ncbi:MAG: hypothetical protein HYV97_12125 [Bdellovibrio sp.]|nr:hypothetical protein [Bdellovibrio sp.]
MSFLFIGIIFSCTSISDEEWEWRKLLDFVVKEERDSQRSEIKMMTIRDASSSEKQEWITEPEKWIKANEKEYEAYRYFLYTTTPQISVKNIMVIH